MAIKSVTAETLKDFAIAQQAAGNPVATPAEVAVIDATAQPKVEAGVETVSTAPDPGPQPERTPAAEASDDLGEDKPDESSIVRHLRNVAKGLKSGKTRLERDNEELTALATSEVELRRQLQERIKQLEASNPPPAAPSNPRPDRTQYGNSEAEVTRYENDLLNWKDVQTEQRVAAKVAAEFAQREQDQRLAAQAQEARKRFSDYDQVIDRQAKADGVVPPFARAAVLRGKAGAFLAYHLAKHPDEAKEIFAMDPANGLLELGRIEQQYLPKAETPTSTTTTAHRVPVVPTSKAPEPMPAIVAGSGDVTTDLSKADTATYMRVRREQIRKQLATGKPRYRG